MLLLLAACPSALAAFPGRNGLLAVQPVSGSGIVLVHPDGSGAHRICTVSALCGRPAAPRFSPNGRAIVFADARSLRIGIVATDGTCLWCLLGAPLTTGFGHHPAFTGNGAVTFAQETNTILSRVGLTTGRTTRLVRAPVSDGVTSARGRVAIVRGAWIWIRDRAGRLNRLVRGSAPSWSPSGAYLAFVHRGWIWSVRVSTAAARRLAPGTAPAWSPSGTRIAYIAPGQAVSTMTTSGRGRHPVATVRGRSVDWQPVVPGAMPCSTGNGAIVTQNSDTVIRQALSGTPAGGQVGWNGCLRALGTAHHLGGGQTGGCYASVSLSGARIAGRFTTLNTRGCDHENLGCEQSSAAALYQVSGGHPSVALDSGDCRSTISPVAVNTSGFTAWLHTTDDLGPQDLGAISCPSAALCVAADESQSLTVSANPTGGTATWQPVFLDRAVTSLSCPTPRFCLGVSFGNVVTTTNPTGGAAAWTVTRLPAPALAPLPSSQTGSCPSPSFCTVAGGPGQLFISTDPTGPTRTWQAVTLGTGDDIAAVSCPSASFCAALDPAGHLFTSTDPTGGNTAWTEATIDSGYTTGLACPTVSLCIATDIEGNIVSSTDPTGGASAWSGAHVGAGMFSVACGSSALCVATTGNGVATSTDPAAGAGAWTTTPAPTSGANPIVSCQGTAFCAIADGNGHVSTSTDPAAGGSTYTSVLADNGPCGITATACVAEQLNVRDDAGTRVVDSTPPSPAAPIGAPQLSGNSLAVTWTDAGRTRSLTLH